MSSLAQAEASKYEAAWSLSEYRKFSPGETYAEVFKEIAQYGAVVDIGCGEGRGGLALKELGFSPVRFLDHVKVADLEPFTQTTLWEWEPFHPYDWGYCCDVMEHIPTEMVGLSLQKIKEHVASCFFTIGLTHDHFGQFVGEPLHMTVRPFVWWRDFLKNFGKVEEARDLLHTGLYVVRFQP